MIKIITFSRGQTIWLVVCWLIFIWGIEVKAARIFFGEDINREGDGVRINTPNADAARNAFFAQLVNPTTTDFEGFVDGSVPPLTLGFGTLTASGRPVKNIPTGTFNGAFPSSGDQFLLNADEPVQISISLDNPQLAFGFFATDAGDADDGDMLMTVTLIHLDDSETVLSVPHTQIGPPITGSALYFGVIADRKFHTIIVTNGTSTLGAGYDDFTTGRLATVGGAVSGMSPTLVICKNTDTGQSVVIRDGAPSWDCEAAGLGVNSGEQIRQTIKGIAD